MYLLPNKYHEAYHHIIDTSLTHSTCKLVIFVSCLDIDALCASRILAAIFKKKLINYQIVPIVGYADLANHYARLDSEVNNIILVGCGATVDLESFLQIDVSQYVDATRSQETEMRLTRKIFVLDGHRPWNLDNVFGSAMVTCFDDGLVEGELAQERAAYDFLVTIEDEELGQSLDEDQEEDREEGDGFLNEGEEEDGAEEEEEDADTVLCSASRKRKSSDSPSTKQPKTRRHEIKLKEETIEAYYSQGTTIGTSITSQVYSLVSLIGETNNLDNLWLSIIGSTSLENRYPELWSRLSDLFRREVVRLGHGADAERTADDARLTVEKDYNLYLMRHWSLYDAFFYSNYINSKVLLYTEQGKSKLNKMFAKMGISLSVAQQLWIYMDITIKKKLSSIFTKVLVNQYGFDELVREGYFRSFGFSGSISARDCVEAIASLLEHDDGKHVDAGPGDDIEALTAEKEKLWVANFWRSWDALTDLKKLHEGVKLSLYSQKLIFQVGHSVIEKRQMKNLKIFRLVVLSGNDYHLSLTSSKDASIHTNTQDTGGRKFFSNPLNLMKLGNWLLDTISEVDDTLLPLVLASLDQETDTYLVIGMTPKYPKRRDAGAAAVLNTFSVAFQHVANTTGVKVRIDSFESSVIEIRKDDLAGFLEKLTLSGLV